MMKTRTAWNTLTLFAILAAVTILPACDAQVDPSYPGESLATITGTIFSERTSPPPAAEAAIVWLPISEFDERSYLATKTAVDGDFPSEFELNIYAPPPDAALFGFGEPGFGEESPYAMGSMVVIEAGSADDGILEEGDGLGYSSSHFVLFLERDQQAGTLTSDLFGGPLAAGYHLMTATFEGGPDQPPTWREAERGLSTPVEITLFDM